MYEGTPIDPILAALQGGGAQQGAGTPLFDARNPYVVDALRGGAFGHGSPPGGLDALVGALAGYEPAPPEPAPPPAQTSFSEGFPTLDAMPGGVFQPPSAAPSGSAPWGMLSPEEGRGEVEAALPGLRSEVQRRQSELEAAKAAEAPAMLWGAPIATPSEVQRAAQENAAAAEEAVGRAEAQLKGEQPLPEASETRHLLETGAQSAVGSLADAPRFAGYIGGWIGSEMGSGVDPTNNAVFRLGQRVSDWSKEAFPGDPARSHEMGTDVANLAGFLAALYGASGVKAMTQGGPALVERLGGAVSLGSQAALAASAGGMGQFEGATQAMEEGGAKTPIPGATILDGAPETTERDRALATLLGAGVGLTSLIPAASAMATPAEREAGAVMARALQGSGVGAAQMAAFNVMNNAVAREFYDPDRSPTQGMGRGVLLGGLFGGAAHGAAAALGRPRVSTPEEIDAFLQRARAADPEGPSKGAYWDDLRQVAAERVPMLGAPAAGAPMEPLAGPPEPTPKTPAESPSYALKGFYRPDVKAVETAPQQKATAGQWLSLLNKAPGAKRWLDLTGFDDWINSQKGSVSREDVLDFMRAHDVEVEERTLEKPKFADYVVPQGENYREMLITLPELSRKGYASKHFGADEVLHLRVDDRSVPGVGRVLFLNELQSDIHQAGRTEGYRSRAADEVMAELQRGYERRMADWRAKVEAFQSGEGAELEKTVSDLTRKVEADDVLRRIAEDEGGFSDAKEGIEFVLRGISTGRMHDDYFDPLVKWMSDEIGPENLKKIANYELKRRRLEDAPEPPVARNVLGEEGLLPPEAPFKGSWWPEIGVKYLIRRAVEDGYDAFALPNSEQIEPAVRAKSGSLSPYYDRNLPKMVEKYVKRLGGRMEEADIGLSKPAPTMKTLESVLKALKDDPGAHGLSESDLSVINDFMRQRIFSPDAVQSPDAVNDALRDFPPALRDAVTQGMEKFGRPRPNKIVRVTDEMRRKVLGEGQPLAASPRRVADEAEALLKTGKTFEVSPDVVQEVRDAVAPLQDVTPKDVGVHVLTRVEPLDDGRLLAYFEGADGSNVRLSADAFPELSDLRGFCLNDGAVCIASMAPGRGAPEGRPAADAEVGAPDPHGGVFLHEAVHALRRRGLFPAADWDRFVGHANALQVLDMPMHEYLALLGEEVKPGVDTVRDNYEIAYSGYPREEAKALLDEEEPVAHMMELLHQGYYGAEQMSPIADLVDKMLSGGYARSAPERRSVEDLEAVQDDLGLKIEELIENEFPDADVADWEDRGWDALAGAQTGVDEALLRRVTEAHPEETALYRRLRSEKGKK